MIYVVEPHADDAFLSLGGHLEDWWDLDHDVTIVTVFSGTRKRGLDAKHYTEAIGVNWIGLNAVEGDPILPLWEPEDPSTDTVILPLGITHPEHISVRAAYSNLKWSVQYYLDQPYASVQRNSARVSDLLDGCIVKSYKRPGIRKYRHIPLFKDQAKFFYYNPADKLAANIELIVEVIP